MLPLITSLLASKNTKNAVIIIVVIVIILVLFTIGKKTVTGIVQKIRGNRFDEMDGKKTNQLILRLRSAIEGAGTNEDAIYKVMKELATIDNYNQLSKIFKSKYSVSLGDYLESDLGSEELVKAFSYLKE